MDKNPYAAPSAPVADRDQLSPPDQSNPLFAAGVTKVIVMSLVTFGIYELYWMYRHWRLIQGRDRSDIMPFWRAVFGVIFVYPLFQRMRDDGQAHAVEGTLAAGQLATAYILTVLTWRLPDPWWLIGFASVLVCGIAQRYANEVNAVAAPGHERNARFSGWNWFGIVAGGLFFALVLIGLSLPDPGE